MRPTREFPVDPANHGRLRQLRRVADHVARAAEQVPAGRARSGGPHGPHAGRIRLRAASRCWSRRTARSTPSSGSSISTSASPPTTRIISRPPGATSIARRSASPTATLAGIAAEAKVSAKYLPMIWQILEEPTRRQRSARSRSCRRCGARCRRPRGNQPDAARARNASRCAISWSGSASTRRCSSQRRWCRGLTAASQPLMNWKLRAVRLAPPRFRSARRCATIPIRRRWCPRSRNIPGCTRKRRPRWAALTAKARAGRSRSGRSRRPSARAMRPRSRASPPFSRTRSTSRERGRFFPDDSQDKGRLLSAGYHNVMGYFRDDTPLMELILDEKGQKELNRLWDEFDFIADYTARTWVQYYFNQSGEVQGKGARVRHAAAVGQGQSARRRDHLRTARRLPRQGRATEQQSRSRSRRSAITSSGSTTRSGRLERMRVEAEPRHLDALLKFAARAYRRPLTQAERDRHAGVLSSLREKSGLTHEEAMRDSIVSVLMSPNFCYRIDLRRCAQPKPPSPARPSRGAATRPTAAALRLRARQPAELFPLVEHAGRGAAGARGGRRSAEAGRPGRAGAPHAEGRARARPGRRVRAATGSTSAASKSTTPSIASASRASTTSCARRCSRSRSGSSRT